MTEPFYNPKLNSLQKLHELDRLEGPAFLQESADYPNRVKWVPEANPCYPLISSNSCIRLRQTIASFIPKPDIANPGHCYWSQPECPTKEIT